MNPITQGNMQCIVTTKIWVHPDDEAPSSQEPFVQGDGVEVFYQGDGQEVFSQPTQ